MVKRTVRLSVFISLCALSVLVCAQSVLAQSPLPPQSYPWGDTQRSYIHIFSEGLIEVATPPVRSSGTGSCTLPAPNLTSPENGALVDTVVPEFKWSGTGTDQYRIQIATSSDFSTMIIDDHWTGLSGAIASVDFPTNLSANTTYHWRVASICADDVLGVYSTAASFSTGNIIGPFQSPPPMIAPADGAVLTSLAVTFSWGDVPGAAAWQLHTYRTLDDAQNDQRHSTRWSDYWSKSTRKTFTDQGVFYWRILARDDRAWGPLSPIRTFTILLSLPKHVYLPMITDQVD